MINKRLSCKDTKLGYKSKEISCKLLSFRIFRPHFNTFCKLSQPFLNKNRIKRFTVTQKLTGASRKLIAPREAKW